MVVWLLLICCCCVCCVLVQALEAQAKEAREWVLAAARRLSRIEEHAKVRWSVVGGGTGAVSELTELETTIAYRW